MSQDLDPIFFSFGLDIQCQITHAVEVLKTKIQIFDLSYFTNKEKTELVAKNKPLTFQTTLSYAVGQSQVNSNDWLQVINSPTLLLIPLYASIIYLVCINCLLQSESSEFVFFHEALELLHQKFNIKTLSLYDLLDHLCAGQLLCTAVQSKNVISPFDIFSIFF